VGCAIGGPQLNSIRVLKKRGQLVSKHPANAETSLVFEGDVSPTEASMACSLVVTHVQAGLPLGLEPSVQPFDVAVVPLEDVPCIAPRQAAVGVDEAREHMLPVGQVRGEFPQPIAPPRLPLGELPHDQRTARPYPKGLGDPRLEAHEAHDAHELVGPAGLVFAHGDVEPVRITTVPEMSAEQVAPHRA